MSIVSLNGRLVSSDETYLPLNDRGFLLGDGLFETLYYSGQQLECANAHWQRLQKGLALFEISFLKTFEFVHTQIRAVLDANGLINQTAAVRLTVTRGAGARGLQIPMQQSPMWMIQVSPYNRSSLPVLVGFSKHCHPGKSVLSGVKHLGYQLSILGRLEARQKGMDDVLFVNKKGEVVGATAANVFAVMNNEIVTPPLSSGCLPGTKRGQVIEHLKAKGVHVIIRPLLRQEVAEEAEGMFLTNSLIDMQPVSFIAGRGLSSYIYPIKMTS